MKCQRLLPYSQGDMGLKVVLWVCVNTGFTSLSWSPYSSHLCFEQKEWLPRILYGDSSVSTTCSIPSVYWKMGIPHKPTEVSDLWHPNFLASSQPRDYVHLQKLCCIMKYANTTFKTSLRLTYFNLVREQVNCSKKWNQAFHVFKNYLKSVFVSQIPTQRGEKKIQLNVKGKWNKGLLCITGLKYVHLERP